MAAQRVDERIHEQETGRAMRRRGILAAAGAVFAGIVAKQAEPVAAAYTLQGDTANVANATTIIAPIVTLTNAPVLQVANGFLLDFTATSDAIQAEAATNDAAAVRAFHHDAGAGLHGSSPHGIGAWGQSTDGTGVMGTSMSGVGMGVQGLGGGDASANTTGFPIGVRGSVPNTGYGVYGNAGVGYGLYGNATGGGVGVGGTSAQSNGVYGTTGGTGVVAGVYGTSSTAYGIIGRTTAAGYSGLTAITSTTGVAALAATSTNPNAYAAYFQGATIVQGNFVAFGGSKSAAVKDAAGQHRLVYCVESPESWFEDFGKAKLINGTAQVTLDKTFTEIAHTDEYHVFLTEYGDHNALFVAKQTAAGFAVRAKGNPTASGTFSYRVVAKRADIKGERLAKFDMPKIHIPDESKLQRPAPLKAAPSPLPVTKP